ncbi:Hypothetical predicted protein, partial [Paramuricea clavata]
EKEMIMLLLASSRLSVLRYDVVKRSHSSRTLLEVVNRGCAQVFDIFACFRIRNLRELYSRAGRNCMRCRLRFGLDLFLGCVLT